MNRRDFIKISALSLLFAGSAVPAISGGRDYSKFTAADKVKFDKIIDKYSATKYSSMSIGELTAEIGKEFLGIPYVGGTLEVSDKEICVLNLSELDCVTFYENALAFARIIKKKTFTETDFRNELTLMRYRDGKIGGYVSRLHYTSDWIRNNIEKGIISDITPNFSYLKKVGDVGFMSENPKYYKQLKNNPKLVKKVASIEAELNADKRVYVPKKHVKEIESELQSGDIIAIATSIKGLDYSHTGMIVKEGKKARFLHASSKEKKVILDGRISDYLSGNKKALGISVVRG